ncbi:MAG: hypothetical protein HQM10_25540 [Candidatus Riflebacteria bacterium]|nr:hypothetical protein [Candidatus Riflebacteria bacterium]
MRNLLRNFCLAMAFSVLSTGLWAVESMGKYQNTASEDSTYFDTVVWTYTAYNTMNVQITFNERDVKLINDGSPDEYQFYMELSRADYEKIFEANEPVTNFANNDHMWDRNISTQISGNKRTVKISFTNAVDAEITSVFKRGTLEAVFENGMISSLKMQKEKKRFLNMGGFKNTFNAEAKSLKKTANGLSLRDEGEMGRLLKAENIDFALKNKNTKGFRQAVDSEK